VVIIEHKLEWVAVFADRVIVLSQGTVVVDGEPGAVLTGEGLREYGVGQTRYTQAARRARQAGFWPADRRLAVTLEEAVAGFGEANGG